MPFIVYDIGIIPFFPLISSENAMATSSAVVVNENTGAEDIVLLKGGVSLDKTEVMEILGDRFLVDLQRMIDA